MFWLKPKNIKVFHPKAALMYSYLFSYFLLLSFLCQFNFILNTTKTEPYIELIRPIRRALKIPLYYNQENWAGENTLKITFRIWNSYTNFIRPIQTYGAVVWWIALSKNLWKQHQQKAWIQGKQFSEPSLDRSAPARIVWSNGLKRNTSGLKTLEYNT